MYVQLAELKKDMERDGEKERDKERPTSFPMRLEIVRPRARKLMGRGFRIPVAIKVRGRRRREKTKSFLVFFRIKRIARKTMMIDEELSCTR